MSNKRGTYKSTDLEKKDQDTKKKTGGAPKIDAVKPDETTSTGKALGQESNASELPADYSDVSIVYMRPANLIVGDTPSGESYTFFKGEAKAIGNQPGDVKPEDVDYLLSKNRSKGDPCCGATGETVYFMLQPMEVQPMSLVTGTPLGNVVSQEDELFLEGAPYIYYQDTDATPLFNPDVDGFYWGMSGTPVNPAYELVCYQDVALGEDLTVNAIRCDRQGDTGVIQKRNHLELTVTLSTLFPLSTLAPVMKMSAVTESAPFEKVGIGPVDNQAYYQVYMPKVYDEVNGDYVVIQLHKAQFVNAFNLQMPSGDRWMVGGVNIWAFADPDKPSAQQFATIIRYDPSLIT